MLRIILIFMLIFCQQLFSDTVKIAYISDFSGESARELLINYQGLMLAVDEMNAVGGVLGKQIEVVSFDNKGSEIETRIAAEKAIKLNPVAILGCPFSSYALAAVDLIQKAKIPFITETATNPDVTRAGDYIFRVCFTDGFQGKVLANFARNDLKAHSAIILADAGSVYSTGLAKIFENTFTENKGIIKETILYSQNEKDFSVPLEKIKKINPDLVFVPAHQTEAGLIIYQAMRLKIKSILLGADGWGIDLLNDYAKNTAQNCYFSAPWSSEVKTKINQNFISNYKAKFGQNAANDGGGAQAYDAVKLLVSAIERAKSFEHSKVRDALTATKNFIGASGKISFNNSRDPNKSIFINELKKDKILFYKEIEP